MRKVLSFVLVLSLVLGSFGFAFAAPADVEGTKNETAVDVLMALEIINGYEDGTFRPDNIVTRAEMAKILIAASGYGDIVNEAKSSFSDMTGHWADKYVAYAASLGLVNGYPDGTFKPNATVSYAEAATMMIRALGYSDEALRGTWPANYVTQAMVLGLFDKVATKVGGATRGDIAEMTFALLDEKIGKIREEDKIFEAYDPVDNMLTRLGAVKVDNEYIDPSDNSASKSYIDLTDYVGQVVDLYKEKTGDEKYLAVTKVESDVIKGKFDVPNLTLKDANGKEYKVTTTTGITLYTNGVSKAATVPGDFDDLQVTIAGTLSGVTMNPGSISGWVYDDLFKVAQSDLYAIEDVVDNQDDDIFDATVPRKDDDTISGKMKVTGDATKLEEIEKDDIVAVYTNDDDEIVKIEVSRKVVEGKVTKKTGATAPDAVYIDGKGYKIAAGALSDFGDYNLGATVEAYLAPNGMLAYVKEVDSASAGNYAMVLTTNNGNDEYGIPAKVKLMTKTGEIISFEIDKDADFVSGSATTALVGVTGADVIQLTGDAITAVVPQAIVKYSTNASGDINKITFGEYDSEAVAYNSRTNRLGGAKLASNVVIFKYSAAEGGNKSKLITAADLEDDGTTFAAVTVANSDGDVVAVSVTTQKAADDLYGVVVSFGNVLDADDNEVKEVNMLINGEAQTYITSATFDDSIIANDGFYQIKLAGGKIGGATAVYRTLGAIKTDAVSITAIDTDDNVVTLNGTPFEYGPEATVYVATFNADGNFDKWEKASETVLRTGAYAFAYDVYDKDEDDLDTTADIYDTIFVFKKADLDEPGAAGVI